MTKRDLVTRISRETNLVQSIVLTIVQKTFDYISGALGNGEKVELRNFGVFEVKVRKARIGRNPKAPATDVRIPARAVVKFKAGKKMGGMIMKLSVKKVARLAKATRPASKADTIVPPVNVRQTPVSPAL